MERRCPGASCQISVILLVAVLLFPIVAAGQFISTNVSVMGGASGSVVGSQTITTDINWDAVLADPDPTNLYTYEISSPINIMSEDNSTILATLDELTIAVKADPYILLDFSVTTPGYATAFTFTSDELTFDALKNSQAYAYASMGISTDGASVYGGYSMKTFTTLYNGSTWTDLLQTPITGEGTFDDSAGWEALPGHVSSMQSQFKFTLTDSALASGSSYYEVIGELVPEPATIVLLSLGGLLLRKRR